MNRKDFIKTCGMLCAGAAGLSLLQACAAAPAVHATVTGRQLTVPKTDFLRVKNGQTETLKMIQVRAAILEFPVALFRIGENEYAALLMQCTHQGCELNPAGNFLVCPCHGSEFDNRGKVLNPPADRDLKRFKTSSDEKEITIYTDSHV